MKTFVAAAVAITLFAGNIFAGDIGSMMKAKARGSGGENAALPSAPPPSQPGQPSAPTVPPPQVLTPEQAALARVVADLNGVKTDDIEKLRGNLMEMVRGASKPSLGAVRKLAQDLATALAGKTLAPSQRSRVAQDLQAVLGGVTVPALQMNDIIADVPALLKKAGADAKAAGAVGDDLKSIAAEIKKPAAK